MADSHLSISFCIIAVSCSGDVWESLSGTDPELASVDGVSMDSDSSLLEPLLREQFVVFFFICAEEEEDGFDNLADDDNGFFFTGAEEKDLTEALVLMLFFNGAEEE